MEEPVNASISLPPTEGGVSPSQLMKDSNKAWSSTNYRSPNTSPRIIVKTEPGLSPSPNTCYSLTPIPVTLPSEVMSGGEPTPNTKSAFSYFTSPFLAHNRQRNVYIDSNGKLQQSPDTLANNQGDVPVQKCISPRLLPGAGGGGGSGGGGGGGNGSCGDAREFTRMNLSSIQGKTEQGVYRIASDKDKSQCFNENNIPAHEKQCFLPSGVTSQESLKLKTAQRYSPVCTTNQMVSAHCYPKHGSNEQLQQELEYTLQSATCG